MAEDEPRYPVTITFSNPGTCPPVFVAGSFTSPEWQVHELECSDSTHEDTTAGARPNHVFSRTFHLPEGTFQYKFRLGDQGNWWVCDGNAEIVTDAAGNQNNCLSVAPSSPFVTKNIARRRVSRPDDFSTTSSGAPSIPSASPSPATSILHRMFVRFKWILGLLFRRKVD